MDAHFLTCSWRFLRLDKLEQLKFKLEKIIGIEKHAGKVRKNILRVQWYKFCKNAFAKSLPASALYQIP